MVPARDEESTIARPVVSLAAVGLIGWIFLLVGGLLLAGRRAAAGCARIVSRFRVSYVMDLG
jgi:hypothetical protein